MANTRVAFKNLFFYFALIFVFGCANNNSPIILFNGDWVGTKYWIAPISAWDTNDAKQIIGSGLSLSGDDLTFKIGEKNYKCNLTGKKNVRGILSKLMPFDPTDKSSFDFDIWKITLDQNVTEYTIDCSNLPFVLLFALEKDKKIIMAGNGGIFLFENVSGNSVKK